MDAVEGREAEVVVGVMRKYLIHGPTGCGFAAIYAATPGAIQWGVWSGTASSASPHAALSALFTSAAKLERPGIAVFPGLRTAEDIAELLAELAGKPGWWLSSASWGKKYPRTDALVSLWWRTPGGLRTSVMGFAPLGSMPVTRRAPFVALAAWTGPKLNPQKSSKMKADPPDEVGFVDMRILNPETHDSTWDTTRTRVQELKALTQEGAALPAVAFCLPSSCASRLAPLYQVPST